jgi:hypothetical protein
MTRLRCAGCNHRFGKRARTVLLFESFVLCVECSTSVTVHKKVFGCREPHTARAHGGDLTTIGIARSVLANPITPTIRQ